ncbi:MAG: AAA family ATPase, partial [Bacteroidota bacterium]
MNISKIHLQNFKRFTDLTIDHIPSDTKLVLLIGSNGSGKSSLFDAFGFIQHAIKKDTQIQEDFWNYFKKNKAEDAIVSLEIGNKNDFTLSSSNFNNSDIQDTAFYGRTSFRQIPRLTRTALGQGESVDFQKDSDRPKFFIERDNRFENDIEKITEIILKDFFRSGQSNQQIRKKYIEPINQSLQNIFGHQNGTKLELLEIIPPLEGKVAQITFQKGDSEFHYNYLSAGEKEVFNLLINLLSRSSLYQDTIYFLDEIDLHLNTKLQSNLLKEITENWIPPTCQLWTATHSLGFIEYANQSEDAVIIDFDDLDFDLPQILVPAPKDDPDIYEIAVGKEMLPALFRQMTIFFVENKDKDHYASVGIPNTIFVSDNNRNNVFHKVRISDYKGLVDRDFLSDDDITEIRKTYSNLYILDYYSMENYLYHPHNLLAYHQQKKSDFDVEKYKQALTEAKNQIKRRIIPNLSLKRTEYPFFKEPRFNGTSNQNRFKNKQENADQSTAIANNLESDDFETFYKSLPMKSYCTQLPQRQNIAKSELSKTKWFSQQIQRVIQQSGIVLLLFVFLLFACAEKQDQAAASQKETADAQLGEISLEVTGAAAAKPHFEKGLLLLHSFEYEDAREAFQAAQAVDSTFAMAYWGEAMTHNHSLWQQQDKEKALVVLNQLASDAESRAALVETELERDFLTAIEILYGEGTKYERDVAYKNYMERLSKKYPNQHEVAAFYAISLLGAARNGRDKILYDKSAKIAKGIIEENPNHPGALHYLIHSYDDPLHAFMATNAADNYSKVAPDAAHALHMPSHIYIALGRWNDVVNSNIASWNASVKRMENKGLKDNARSLHALNWLQYGFLQRGEVERATPLLRKVVEYAKTDSSTRTRSYLLAMKGGHLAETEDWKGEFANLEIDVSDLNILSKAGYAFLEGMKAYHQKEETALVEIIEEMKQARNLAVSVVGDQGFAMCSAGGYAGRPPNQLDVDMAHIIELELKAYLADLNGKTEQANQYFEEGMAIEEGL